MPETLNTDINLEAIYQYILSSFSNKHEVTQEDGDFHITNEKGRFVLKTFSKEAIKGSSKEVRAALEDMVAQNKEQGIATGFLFLRCITDYKERKNRGAFLKQSWDRHLQTGASDNYNVKRLTGMERLVESFYDSGCDMNGYRSRVTYFNPKTGKIESIRFRENSSEHRISNTLGYVCDWKCIRGLYQPGEPIEHQRCKTEKCCTLYARGRDKREVIITELGLPLRMTIYRRDNLLLAEIR